MTTPHSDRVTRFARRVRELVLRIEGPVAWITIHNLKDLRTALDCKIKELSETEKSEGVIWCYRCNQDFDLPPDGCRDSRCPITK